MDAGSASAVDANSCCNVDAASRSASTVDTASRSASTIDAAFSSVMAGTGSSCSHQRKALPLIQCPKCQAPVAKYRSKNDNIYYRGRLSLSSNAKLFASEEGPE